MVLASGGYQGNAELMARYHGDRALTTRPVARGGNYNKGEGLEMALALGAATAGNFSLFHAEPVDPRSGEPEAAIFCFPYGVLVNHEGRALRRRGTRARSTPGTNAPPARSRPRPSGVAWVVLDQQALAVPNVRSGIRTDQPPVRADTVDELALRLGVPRDALVATVAAYNDACPDGDFDHAAPDGLATEGLTPPKSNWARPLSQGPYEAYPIMAANVFTFGGLKTTPPPRCWTATAASSRGLYAAGEMTGLYYSNYTGSTSVLRGAVFGRIAGAERRRDPGLTMRIWHQSFTVLDDVPHYRDALRRHLSAQVVRRHHHRPARHGAGDLPVRLPRHAHRLRLPRRAAQGAVRRRPRCAPRTRGTTRSSSPPSRTPATRRSARSSTSRSITFGQTSVLMAGAARRLRRHRELHRRARTPAPTQPAQLPSRRAGRPDHPGGRGVHRRDGGVRRAPAAAGRVHRRRPGGRSQRGRT